MHARWFSSARQMDAQETENTLYLVQNVSMMLTVVGQVPGTSRFHVHVSAIRL